MKISEELIGDAFLRSLVPVKRETLERGDPVYEVHTDGKHVRAKKYRVLDVNHTAAKCCEFEQKQSGRTVRLIRLSDLMVEPVERVEREQERKVISMPVPKPKHAERESTPAKPAAADDQIAAWLDMGRDLVAGIDAEERTLQEQRAKLERDLEAIDATHRRRIGALEAELATARKAHENDRALAAAGRDAIDAKLAGVSERKAALEKMLGGG